MAPKATNLAMGTLWKVKLRIGDEYQEFLFRQRDDWESAAKTAQDLVDKSAACDMVGATIVAVERVAHLWN